MRGFGAWEVHQAGPGWLLGLVPVAAAAVVAYEVLQEVIAAVLVATGCVCVVAVIALGVHLRRELRTPTGIHVRPVKSIRESRNVRAVEASQRRAIERGRVVQGVVLSSRAGEKVER